MSLVNETPTLYSRIWFSILILYSNSLDLRTTSLLKSVTDRMIIVSFSFLKTFESSVISKNKYLYVTLLF